MPVLLSAASDFDRRFANTSCGEPIFAAEEVAPAAIGVHYSGRSGKRVVEAGLVRNGLASSSRFDWQSTSRCLRAVQDAQSALSFQPQAPLVRECWCSKKRDLQQLWGYAAYCHSHRGLNGTRLDPAGSV
jgi:hypothetical protein